ncbi:uncharacterized protein LOC131926984 [Physella acuta]|uniref:uncharacterized protein LOC131926984 n=1 Tax=Physella acuta TaxID=109671 RepID=UPI0027DAFB2C|nr:uncharacterized protein LOC131926984 [Physella acuta]
MLTTTCLRATLYWILVIQTLQNGTTIKTNIIEKTPVGKDSHLDEISWERNYTADHPCHFELGICNYLIPFDVSCQVNFSNVNKLIGSWKFERLSIEADANTFFPDNSIPETNYLRITSAGATLSAFAWKKSKKSLKYLNLKGVTLSNATASFEILTEFIEVHISNSSLNGQSDLKINKLENYL